MNRARQTVAGLVAQWLPTQWRTLTVAEGAQGPRTYQFGAVRVWESRTGCQGGKVGCWFAATGTAVNSSTISPMPADTPRLRLAEVSALRWPVETEFQTEKGETGLDEYEVRSWHGWHHHITMALLAGAFLLTLQLDWGKSCPRSPAHS